MSQRPSLTYKLAGRDVKRMGYGAMQLAGKGVFGPPRDHQGCLDVLRAAIAAGVDHIDTSDFYGPHVTNRIIKEALHPYPADLTLVTKVGARRDEQGNWLPWNAPTDLEQGVRDNLEHLGLDAMEVVNLRVMGFGGDGHGPGEGSIGKQVETMAKLQQQGLLRHIGLSNVTAKQVAEAQAIAPIVCVQNLYNLVHRDDDALIDQLTEQGIAYVPFFPLGGFTPIQSDALSGIAARLKVTPMQLALAWLLYRAPNILLIPGTSSVGHLRENLAASELVLDEQVLSELGAIGGNAAAH